MEGLSEMSMKTAKQPAQNNVAPVAKTPPVAGKTPKRAVGITETGLRDAHQSIMATRLRTSDMIPICEALDEVGYHSLEMWGGATFDAAMRFLSKRRSCRCCCAGRT